MFISLSFYLARVGLVRHNKEMVKQNCFNNDEMNYEIGCLLSLWLIKWSVLPLERCTVDRIFKVSVIIIPENKYISGD